jgi:hypothetical protein
MSSKTEKTLRRMATKLADPATVPSLYRRWGITGEWSRKPAPCW